MNSRSFARRIVFFTIATLSVSSWCFAKTFVLSVRGSEIFVEHYLADHPDFFRLSSSAREFGNTNTFVQIPGQVAGHEVHIFVPEVLTPDSFFETLIKIHTARTKGAAKIVVVSDTSLQQQRIRGTKEIFLDHALAFSVAGAHFFSDLSRPNTKMLDLRRLSLNKPRSVTVQDVVVLGHRHPEFRDSIAKHLHIEAYPRSVSEWCFSNAGDRKSRSIYLVAPSTSPVNEHFLTTLEEVFDLTTSGHRVTLVSPYLPYARSDKRDISDVSVVGSLAAHLLEAFGSHEVVFARAHAPQSEGFFRIPSTQITGRATIEKHLKTLDIDIVIGPDEGSQKDVTIFAKDLGKGIAIINKKRDPKTGKFQIVGISGDDVAGKSVVIVDDETESGGTLAEGAEYLIKVKKAKSVTAVVTHLGGGGLRALESEYIRELVVTNTLPIKDLKNPKLKVLDITAEVAEGIRPGVDVIKTSKSGDHECGVEFF